MFLTQSGGLIMGPLSKLLGLILSLIYDGLNALGSVNVGIAIIIFTFVVRLAILPMMINQNKSTKVMNYIQPEINKITKKYKGKKDQESMIAQQRETQAIQRKYGVSMTGGCLTGLIQLPVFFALYRVIQNVPAYVTKVKDLYKPIANAIATNQASQDIFANLKTETLDNAYATVKQVSLTASNTNSIIDVLAKMPADAWDSLKEAYAGNEAVISAINDNLNEINHVYDFFGINLTSVPGWAFPALIIPICSFIFQFLSMKVTPNQSTSGDPTQEATMKSMKTMMYVMPVFSFFICVNVPVGLGLYWAAGALISFLTTIFINLYFKHCDMEKIVNKSMEKAAKKNAKREAKGKVSFWDKVQEQMTGESPDSPTNSNKVNSNAATASLKNYTSNTMKQSEAGTKYRPGSLAAKANMLQSYNDSNNGGKN